MSTLRKNISPFELKTLSDIAEYRLSKYSDPELYPDRQHSQPARPLRIALGLLILVLVLTSCAGVMAPMPHLVDIPKQGEYFIWIASIASALLTLMWNCFSKQGQQYLLQHSDGKISNQLNHYLGMPIFMGCLVAFLSFGMISGITGYVVSMTGSEYVQFGNVQSKKKTTQRGCRFEIMVQWQGVNDIAKECVSEAWFGYVKEGETVKKRLWVHRGLHAQSKYIWPTRSLPEQIQREYLRSKWGGFVFLFGLLLLGLIAYLLTRSLLGMVSALSLGGLLAWLFMKFL